MRKFKLWATFFFLQGTAWAQAKPASFLGTKTPYTAPAAGYVPPPPGFQPVFVNYVGRHGARYLTKAGADTETLQVLAAAESSRGLTRLGQRVRGMVERLCEIERGQYENITLLGAEEQAAIGRRLCSRNRPVFTGKELEVIVTYKARTKQSADAFLHAYARYGEGIHYSKTVDSLDALLRFYDLSPAYLRYKKSAGLRLRLDSLDRDPRTKATAERICSRIFTPAFRANRKPAEAVVFAERLYDLYSVQFSLPVEIRERGYPKDSADLGIAFGREDLEWMDFRNGAADFLEKGPGIDPLGIQVKVAAPLLADFLQRTEEAVGKLQERRGKDGGGGDGKCGGPDAVLRFTHAEAISPLAALLGIPQASVAAASIYHYHEHWQAESVIPLSANIQWILYSNGKDQLVKVLLNEREVSLPVGPGPYYRWEVLKEYYWQRLRRIGVRPGEDMREYLRALIN